MPGTRGGCRETGEARPKRHRSSQCRTGSKRESLPVLGGSGARELRIERAAEQKLGQKVVRRQLGRTLVAGEGGGLAGGELVEAPETGHRRSVLRVDRQGGSKVLLGEVGSLGTE